MIERFLQYSLRWACPIKLVYLDSGQMKTGNLTVVEILEDRISYLSARNKKLPKQLLLADILAAAYARGDDGDTSRRVPPIPKESDDHKD